MCRSELRGEERKKGAGAPGHMHYSALRFLPPGSEKQGGLQMTRKEADSNLLEVARNLYWC